MFKHLKHAANGPLMWIVRLLMFASGVPTAEKPQAKKFFELSYPPHEEGQSHSDDQSGPISEAAPLSAQQPVNNAWENYKQYLAETSILIPLPPVLYRRLPEWVKHTILLDWPMYAYEPGSHRAQ